MKVAAMANRWLSFHVFRSSDQDTFLLKCIPKIEAIMLVEGSSHDLFFLRHWQLGPHIRLRLKSPEQDSLELERKLYTALSTYVNNFPCDPFENASVSEILSKFSRLEGISFDARGCRPDNTVLKIDYIPEVDKFCGLEGTAVAERHFCRSSRLSLDVIANHPSRRRRLGTAISAAVAGACALEVTDGEIATYFLLQARLWAKYVSDDINYVERIFRDKFESQRQSLSPLREMFFNNSNLYNNRWYTEMRVVLSELELLGARLLLGERRFGDITVSKQWYFGFIFGHLFNNRIGVGPAEESYIHYMLYFLFSEKEIA
jgi:hypothetical protein